MYFMTEFSFVAATASAEASQKPSWAHWLTPKTLDLCLLKAANLKKSLTLSPDYPGSYQTSSTAVVIGVVITFAIAGWILAIIKDFRVAIEFTGQTWLPAYSFCCAVGST